MILDALLPMAADRPPSRGRALAGLAAGMISTTTGEWERSRGEWAAAFDDGKAIGDAAVAAEGIMGVGYCLLSLGRPEDAGTALDEAIAEGRPERAVAIAAAAHALSARAGVVIAHPMDPNVAARIEALKASIPPGKLDGLVAGAGTLSPAAILAMIASTAELAPER